MNRRFFPVLLLVIGVCILVSLFANNTFGSRVGVYILFASILVGIPAQILATRVGSGPASKQNLAIEKLGLVTQPDETSIDLWRSPKPIGAIWKMKRAKLFIGSKTVRFADTSGLQENADKARVKLGKRPNTWNSFVKITFPSGRTLLLSQVGPSEPQLASVDVNRRLWEQITKLLV